jgi:TldD protein
MKDLALRALDAVARRGVTYADVRAVDSREREISTKNGKTGHVSSAESQGIGIRVLANGCWGFAATDDLTASGIESASALALEIARAGTAARTHEIALAPEARHEAVWTSPMQVDPFTVPVDRSLAVLLAVDKELRHNPGVSLAEASMQFEKRRQIFVSTLGSVIDQTRCLSGAGFAALSYKDGDIQKRSFPNSFGGQFQLKGYELVDELRLVQNAPRIAEEAVALHAAEQCPEGEFNLILDSAQLGLQIHESIGHPIELDRVLGSEANYAGMSFLTLDQLNHLRYGSEIVNVVCDAREEHGPGLGTFAFDDEGVPAAREAIVEAGVLRGFLSSRETAAQLGAGHGGSMRADGWARMPLVRMTNLHLEPGEGSFDDLLADVDDGLYLETNKSWSIDDKRLNFQFGTQVAWEIKKGKLGRMLRDATYTGVTPVFWGKLDAVAGPEEWTLFGLTNCGKGQPGQEAHVSHGAAPARFRDVEVGVSS